MCQPAGFSSWPPVGWVAGSAGLNHHDRRLVEAWQGLGNDLVAAMLYSGVLRSDGYRVHPNDAARDDCINARLNPPTPRREAAEHEAAHAIVAEALGVRVLDIEVGADGNGETTYERADSEDGAVILVAGQIWIEEFRFREFPAGDSGCLKDQRALLGHTDDFGARLAAGKARRILRDHSDEVHRLAAWLERIDSQTPPLRGQLVQAEIRQITGR